MLGGAGTKKLNSLKIPDGAGIEKASLTQYVTQRWREKLLFTENAGVGWYKKPFNLYVRLGWHEKYLFTENSGGGLYKKTSFNSIC